MQLIKAKPAPGEGVVKVAAATSLESAAAAFERVMGVKPAIVYQWEQAGAMCWACKR